MIPTPFTRAKTEALIRLGWLTRTALINGVIWVERDEAEIAELGLRHESQD